MSVVPSWCPIADRGGDSVGMTELCALTGYVFESQRKRRVGRNLADSAGEPPNAFGITRRGRTEGTRPSSLLDVRLELATSWPARNDRIK